MGGGSLWDVGCYPLSYANLIAGAPPVEVFGWRHASDRGVDMEFFAMIRYADGSVAQFDCGFAGPFRAEMEIAGVGGTLRIRRPFKTDEYSALEFTGTNDTVELVPFASETAYAGEVADMEAAALDGAPPRVALTESRRTVQTILALHASAGTGRPVTL
jgi:predicted dehydrogenase